MSRYSGKQGRKAARKVAELKRVQAEQRNANTPQEKRRVSRLASS